MGFARPAPRSKQYTGSDPSAPRAQPVRIADGRARMVVPLPKDSPKRSKTYLRWVASRKCEHCGREGISQAAHADEGKGLAIKSSDETAFALCADEPGRLGCHSVIGASGTFTQAQRRDLEKTYGARTRLAALAEETWPEHWT